jgi:hypothetical protein
MFSSKISRRNEEFRTDSNISSYLLDHNGVFSSETSVDFQRTTRLRLNINFHANSSPLKQMYNLCTRPELFSFARPKNDIDVSEEPVVHF